jgi:hypothetical protein
VIIRDYKHLISVLEEARVDQDFTRTAVSMRTNINPKTIGGIFAQKVELRGIYMFAILHLLDFDLVLVPNRRQRQRQAGMISGAPTPATRGWARGHRAGHPQEAESASTDKT